jgi:hypothetical protein
VARPVSQRLPDMKPQVGTLYKPDGTVQQIMPRNGKVFSTEELQRLLGGPIEFIPMKRDRGRAIIMYVNQERKLRNLPYNEQATRLLHPALLQAGELVVGDAIVIRLEE